MDVFSYAREFAEDLLKCLTRRFNISWKPLRLGCDYRGQFQSGFYEWIGDVVFYFYSNQKRNPDTLPDSCYLSLRAAHDYIYSRLFKEGNDFFNVLDYCGQLFYFAMFFHEAHGDKFALDNCAVYIAVTITNLMNNYEISEADYWNELRATANKIMIPISPVPLITVINTTSEYAC